jgi:hypothetical protein
MYKSEEPRPNTLVLSIYSCFLKNQRAKGKNKSFLGMGTSRRVFGTRKGGKRLYMVDAFYTHILK